MKNALVRIGATVGPAAVALVLGVATYDVLARQRESRAAVALSRDVIDATERTLVLLMDSKTGQRGFLLTGEERYLEPYTAASAALRSNTALLRALTRDNAD